MKTAIRHVGIIVITLLLTSCGFHLRGSEELSPRLKNLYIQSPDPYSQLVRYLKQSLKQSGVQLAATPQGANTVIMIVNEEQGQQLLGVGGTQQTRLYNLLLKVTFQITDSAGRVLIPLQSVSESRVVTIQANQVLGGSNEETNLYQQMRRVIIFSIMNHLSSKDTTRILDKSTHETTLPTTRPTSH